MKTVTFAPGTRGISAIYTRQGKPPTSGVHTSDGSLFIGSYSKDQWFSDNVKPYHQEIMQARKSNGVVKNPNGGGNQSRKQKRHVNSVKRNKRKLKTLESQISTAKTKLKDQMVKKEDPEDSISDNDEVSDNAGDEFGGKKSKK